jgi:hypothetical protein
MKAYVQLLDEGVDVWREIEVEPLGAGRYRVRGSEPPGESWAFKPGAVVRLVEMDLSEGPALVTAADLEHKRENAGPAAKRLFACRRFD